MDDFECLLMLMAEDCDEQVPSGFLLYTASYYSEYQQTVYQAVA